MSFSLREFQSKDTAAVNEDALAAFEELRLHYNDWPGFSRIVGNMASLAETGELKALHRTAIPLRCIAAGELGR